MFAANSNKRMKITTLREEEKRKKNIHFPGRIGQTHGCANNRICTENN